MDSTAAAMCKDNNIPILVFDLARPDNIYDACMGENIGTLVKIIKIIKKGSFEYETDQGKC